MPLDKAKKRTLKLRRITIAVAIGFPILLLGPRILIHERTNARIATDLTKVPRSEVALVLGAKVYQSGNLSPILEDRVNKAVELYKSGRVKKLLMSGDNRFSHYNEPKRMAEYAISEGVNPKDVAMDFAGRRTYDSVYRAKEIFGLTGIVIVSQRCHVERAIFIADALGIKAHGLAADVPEHSSQYGNIKMALREIPAGLAAMIDLYVHHPYVVMGPKEKV